jgi:hypothetical protein
MQTFEYWDYRYTSQRMKNDQRALKHLRRSYEISRNNFGEWNLSIPIINYDGIHGLHNHSDIKISISLSGVMSNVLWREIYDSGASNIGTFKYHCLGAQLIKYDPSLAGMIKIAKELRSFWAKLPIRVWCEKENGEFGYQTIPHNDADLVAFILTHS